MKSITQLLALSLLVTMGLMSCTTEDSQELNVAPNEPIEVDSETNEVDLTGLNYFVIDGKKTDDLDQVKAMINTAYVKDFDYVNEKLTMFSSEATYMSAVESSPYWRNHEAQRTIELTDSGDNGAGEVIAPATENVHYTSHNFENHSEDLVLDYHWSTGFVAGDFTITDMNNTKNYSMSVHAVYSSSENVRVLSYTYYVLFNGVRTSSNKIYLTNSFDDRDVTLYLYKNTGYGGGYTTINLGQTNSSSNKRLTTSNFVGGTTPYSFKVRYLHDRN